MSVKLSQLKQEEVKAKITVNTPDGEKDIIIKNPTGQAKEALMELIKNNGEETENPDAITYLLTNFTNIDIDVDEIDDVLNNPSVVMVEVLKHLNDIMQEVVFEIITEQTIALSMIEKSIAGKELTDKVEKVNSMVEDMKSKLKLAEQE